MELTVIEKQVAKKLVESINKIPSFDYKELANSIAPPIHHRTQLPTALGNVSYLCHELGLPLLSVKVVNKATNKAGIGFYHLYCELFPDGINKTPDQVEREERQKIRLWDNWQPLLDYLDMNIEIPVSPMKQKQSITSVGRRDMPINNRQADFRIWLENNTNLSGNSLHHYVGAIKSISEWLNVDISEISSEQEFSDFENKCYRNPSFIEKDTTGNRMYSVALKHYKNYIISTQTISVLDDNELIEKINNMSFILDVEIKYHNKRKQRPELVDTPGIVKKHPRDISVSKNALNIAKYQCEYDNSHLSFKRKTPPHLIYTEPHHLIPLSAYDDFEYSLDVEENICSLCSTCHNCLHYGKVDERDKILEKLFSERANFLTNVGLEVTFDKLKKYY